MTPWYKSKQFWFNVLAVLVAVASAFGFGDFQPDPRAVVIAQLVVAAINVALRFAFPSNAPPAQPEGARGSACAFAASPLPGQREGTIRCASGRRPRAETYRRANAIAAATFAALVLSAAAGLTIAG